MLLIWFSSCEHSCDTRWLADPHLKHLKTLSSWLTGFWPIFVALSQPLSAFVSTTLKVPESHVLFLIFNHISTFKCVNVDIQLQWEQNYEKFDFDFLYSKFKKKYNIPPEIHLASSFKNWASSTFTWWCQIDFWENIVLIFKFQTKEWNQNETFESISTCSWLTFFFYRQWLHLTGSFISTWITKYFHHRVFLVLPVFKRKHALTASASVISCLII